MSQRRKGVSRRALQTEVGPKSGGGTSLRMSTQKSSCRDCGNVGSFLLLHLLLVVVWCFDQTIPLKGSVKDQPAADIFFFA